MAEESNVVGRAEIEVVANLEPFQRQLIEGVKAAVERAGAEVPVSLGKAPAGGSAKGAGGSSAATGEVSAKIKDVDGIGEAVQRALIDESGRGFRIPLDTTHIRDQIELALRAPFKIQVEMEGHAGQRFASAQVPLSEPGRPREQSIPPVALHRTLETVKDLPKAVTDLHTTVTALARSLGKDFGKAENGGPLDQLVELTEHFGSDMRDWIRYEKRPTKANADRMVATGGSIADALGLDKASLRTLGNGGGPLLDLRAGRAYAGTGGTTPLSAVMRDWSPRLADAVGDAVGDAVKHATSNIAQPIVEGIGKVVKEAAQPTPSQPAASVRTPDIGTTTPTGATSVAKYSLDELLKVTRQEIGKRPRGSVTAPADAPGDRARRRGGAGGFEPFDIDPTNNEQLTASQILERNHGLFPTPIGKGGFSYSPLLQAAQAGAFSNLAAVQDKKGKETGEYVRVDPMGEDRETKRLLAGRPGKLDDGRRAQGLTPEEAFRRLVRAGNFVDEKTQGSLDDPKSFLSRVGRTAIPTFARTFERAQQLVKPGAELGKRSGVVTGTTQSLEDLTRLDYELAGSFKKLQTSIKTLTPIIGPENIQKLIGTLQHDVSGNPARFAKPSAIGKIIGPEALAEVDNKAPRALNNLLGARNEINNLVTRGADPRAATRHLIPQEQFIRELRKDAASQGEMNLQRQEFIRSDPATNKRGVGIGEEEFNRQRQTLGESNMNSDIAAPAVQRIIKLADDMLSHRLEPKIENIGEAYQEQALHDASGNSGGLTSSVFLRSKIREELDHFRGQFGIEEGRGTTNVPKGFPDLATAVSSAFSAIGEHGTGTPATRRGTDASLRRAMKAPTFEEQDRTAAEGRLHAVSHRRDVAVTDLDQERVRQSGLVPDDLKSPGERQHDQIRKQAAKEALAVTLPPDILARVPTATPVKEEPVATKTDPRAAEKAAREERLARFRETGKVDESPIHGVLPNAKVNLRGFKTQEAVEDVAEGMRNFAYDFPETAKKVTSVKSPRLDRGPKVDGKHAGAWVSGDAKPVGRGVMDASGLSIDIPSSTIEKGTGLRKTVEHELGHFLQMSSGSSAINRGLRDAPTPTEYSKTDDREHFAELIALRRTAPPEAQQSEFYKNIKAKSNEEREAAGMPPRASTAAAPVEAPRAMPTADEVAKFIGDIEKTSAARITKKTPPEREAEIQSARATLEQINKVRGQGEGSSRVGSPEYEEERKRQIASLTAAAPPAEKSAPEKALDSIDRIQRVAGKLIARESGQRFLGNPLREPTKPEMEAGRVAPGELMPDISRRFYSPPTRTGEETAARIKGLKNIPEVLRTEAIQQIEGGVAPGLTKVDTDRRSGKSQTTGLTGDKNREVTSKVGYVPGIAPAVKEPGFGSNGNGSKPPSSTGPGGGKFEGITGPVHVIVDNIPLPISMPEGMTAHGGASTAGSARDIAHDEERVRRARARFAIGGGAEAFSQNVIDRERQKNPDISNAKLSKILKELGYGAQAAKLLDTEGTGGAASAISALERKYGLVNSGVRSITSPNRMAADDARANLNAEASGAERRILSRGFTASVTDLFQSPFFKGQREAVGKFRRETNQLSSLRDKEADAADAVTRAETLKTKIEGDRAAITNTRSRQYVTMTRELASADHALNAARGKSADIADEITRQEDIVAKKRKALPGIGRAGANLAIGGIAAAGAFGLGSLVFQFAGEILGAIQQGLGEAIGPAIERATGFGSTAARVSGGLATTIQGRGGDVDAAAGALGGIGLPSSTLNNFGTPLVARAATEAGNQNLKAQIDALHAAEKISADKGLGGLDKNLVTGTGGFLDGFIQGIPSTAEQLKNELDRGVAFLDLFNENAKRGGENVVKLTQGGDVEGSAGLAQSAGLNELADKLKSTGTSFSGATSAQDILDFLASANKGASTPSADLLLRDKNRELQASVGALNAQSDQQQRLSSAAFSLGNFASPTPTVEERLFPGGLSAETNSPFIGGAVPKEVLESYGDLKDRAHEAFSQIARESATGMAELKNFGVDDATIKNIAQLGTEIKDLQVDVSGQRLAASYQDFNHALDIGKRSLGDLVGLNGKLSASAAGVGKVEASNMGILERDVLLKTRALTIIGQELSQRQINFRKATAGFMSEGLTPEEIAARQAEAKYEADVAQKQLNLQKGITGDQTKIVDEQNLRALKDQIYDIKKLERDFKIQIRIQGEEALIEALGKIRDKAVTDADTTIGKFKGLEDLAVQTAAQIAAQTGEEFSGLLKNAKTTIGSIQADYLKMLQGLPPLGGKNQFGGGSTGSFDGEHGSASGGFFAPQTGGPGDSINSSGPAVVFTGEVNVRSTTDIDEIVRRVERALDRKTALLGLRNPI